MILNAECQKAPRLFMGKEVEHTCFFAHDTLFIVDDVSIATIEDVLAHHPKSQHLYFGAGGLSRINTETVQHFKDAGFHLTMEAVVAPCDMQWILEKKYSLLWTLVIPISNNGIYQGDQVAKCLTLWLAVADYFMTPIYVKLDTSDPHVFVVPFRHFAAGYNGPEAYQGDIQL